MFIIPVIIFRIQVYLGCKMFRFVSQGHKNKFFATLANNVLKVVKSIDAAVSDSKLIA